MKYLALPVTFLAVIFLSGCSNSIVLKEVDHSERYHQLYTIGVDWKGNINHYSSNYLNSNLLLDKFQKSPDEVIRIIDARFQQKPERRYLQVLTDLCSTLGNRYSDDPDKAIKYFTSATYYSYYYLFKQPVYPEKPPQYAPVVFFMTRYYNNALSEVAQYLQKKDLVFRDAYSLSTATDLKLRFKKPLYKVPFPLERYHKKILFCPNYLPQNLNTFSHRPGLGVPLICSLTGFDKTAALKDIDGKSQPVTLFMRLNKRKNNIIDSRLEFYSTLAHEEIKIENINMDIPLELDYSTPLAYDMQKPDMISGMLFMFNPAEIDNLAGLYQITPYQKDKIPVVMVHGLLSSPRTWAQMFNTLLNDPDIRRNYQFWFFAYSTGNPVLYSAKLMRQSLVETRKKYDPDNKNKKFSKMIIVAHSMGGLLSKTIIQNSNEKIVDSLLGMPLEEIEKKITKSQKKFLLEVLMFNELPFVQRVVFMATPHRGSEIATWSLVRWTSSMITLPKILVKKTRDISHNIMVKTKLMKTKNPIHIRTGLENLDPDSKALKLLEKLPFSKRVKYHTISGNEEKAGVPGGTDGVVPYWSSHLDGALSEMIVKSGHSCQGNAAAIEEVRRILLLHLSENGLLNSQKVPDTAQ
jgi:Putative serine esterase (DUF676)